MNNESKNQLKKLIQEAIQETILEVAPPGKKGERMVKHLKTSLKKSHPNWSDDKIKQVAYATSWKKLGESKEAMSPDTKSKLSFNILNKEKGKLKLPPKGKSSIPLKPSLKEENSESKYEYSEEEEIKLIKQLHNVTGKLLDMHGKKK